MRDIYAISFRRVLCDAATFLPHDVYDHCIRVMLYIMSNADIPENLRDVCIVTAVAHDLVEDSAVKMEDLKYLPTIAYEALELLTRDKNVNYIQYVKNIVASRRIPKGDVAYWVKLADMKDHLAQKDTLTDKLRTKYMEALPYLLP